MTLSDNKEPNVVDKIVDAFYNIFYKDIDNINKIWKGQYTTSTSGAEDGRKQDLYQRRNKSGY